MTKGQIEDAFRYGLNELDKWNDVTGVVEKRSGYYYELQGVIEDAVYIGIQMALNGRVKRNKGGQIEKQK